MYSYNIGYIIFEKIIYNIYKIKLKPCELY